jgi:hypothetical protein
MANIATFAGQVEEEVARNLFVYCTKPVPNLQISGQIEIHEPAWNDARLEQVLDERYPMQKNARGDILKNQERVRKLALEDIKRAHSGTNIVTRREWVGPGVYRMDYITDATGRNIDTSHVNIYDDTFSSIKYWCRNNHTESAVISKNKSHYHDTDKFWMAAAIEPHIAAVFIASVQTTNRIPIKPASNNWLNGSFSGFRDRLDNNRLKCLVNGDDPYWNFKIDTEYYNFTNCIVITMESKVRQGNLIQFYMNYPKQSMLFKIFSKNLDLNEESTFTRGNYDSNGIPHEWIQVVTNPATNFFRKITFSEVNVNPSWDVKNGFLPVFPTNYSVSDCTHGAGEIIYWPNSRGPKPQIATDTTESASKKSLNKNFWIVIFVSINIIVISGLIYFRNNHEP